MDLCKRTVRARRTLTDLWERRSRMIRSGPRTLNTPVNLEAVTVDDPKSVASHLMGLAARFNNFKRSDDGALIILHPQPDHAIGDGFFW